MKSAASLVVIATQVLLIGALTGLTHGAQAAQTCESVNSPDFVKKLSFVLPSQGGLPGGWVGQPSGTISLDEQAKHDEQLSVLINRTPESPSSFSDLVTCIPMDFAGKTIELRGYLRTENVSTFAGLWLREDGDARELAINNMQDQHLRGTTGWTEYSISLPFKPQGQRLVFGALLAGTGKVWVANLQLLVDGKPVWEAPKRSRTILDTDHQFDLGSGIHIGSLSKAQISNLVTLGKVWGFLKYYDPLVTSGRFQWDYELFRVMPSILKAPDVVTANAILLHWINGLGPVASCGHCVQPNATNVVFEPDLTWIKNTDVLGKALSNKLQSIRINRKAGSQFYLALTPVVGNPIFKHELAYPEIKTPDSGFQLLALFRFWNAIEYWYPNRNTLGENWDDVLHEYVPKLALASSFTAYQLQLMALIAEIHDSHANLWSSLNIRPPVGDCHIPVRIRYIQGQPVVTAYMDGKQASDSPFQLGDVVVSQDGTPVSALVKEWAPYYGASNEAAKLTDIAAFMTRGPCDKSTVRITRDGRDIDVVAQRVPMRPEDIGAGIQVLPGPAFQLLSPQVAYLKLSAANADDAATYIRKANGTKGLIIDIRDYPSSFVVFALGSLLVNHHTPFVRFTVGDLSNPGEFRWGQTLSVTPQEPHYLGKVVILVNAITQSQAEYTAMAFRTAPGAVVVGSTTAGADGNVSRIPLPGGLFTFISGIGVFYPDGRPTQHVGIVPDVVVHPTIADIREGRDAVLDAGLRQILGPDVPTADLVKLYRDHR